MQLLKALKTLIEQIMTERDFYQSPFSDRYASEEMSYCFSQYFKYLIWRKLWIALAKAQKKLGLPITDQQIAPWSAHLRKSILKKQKNMKKNSATM